MYICIIIVPVLHVDPNQEVPKDPYTESSVADCITPSPDHDHTYYNNTGAVATSSVASTSCRNDQPFIRVGSPVKLLKNFNIVGLGRILDGNHVHGKAIPQDYIKMEITQIFPEIRVILSTPFDDDNFNKWTNNSMA